MAYYLEYFENKHKIPYFFMHVFPPLSMINEKAYKKTVSCILMPVFSEKKKISGFFKVSMKCKMFLNKIKAHYLNNQLPKNEINVECSF